MRIDVARNADTRVDKSDEVDEILERIKVKGAPSFVRADPSRGSGQAARQARAAGVHGPER